MQIDHKAYCQNKTITVSLTLFGMYINKQLGRFSLENSDSESICKRFDKDLSQCHKLGGFGRQAVDLAVSFTVCVQIPLRILNLSVRKILINSP